jgi:isoleucyl-tRNA synthetase
LETARKEKVVGKALEASVTLYCNPDLAKTLTQLEDELRFVLITSKAQIETVETAPENALATEVEGLWLNITASTGVKCSRCWHITDDIGSYAEHPELCGRCVTNVDGAGEARKFA